MYERDIRDIVAGLLICAAGAFAAGYALIHLEMGTLRKVGPGLFPASCGVILLVLGIFVVVPALRRQGPRIEFAPRALFTVLASLLVFGLLIRSFGMIPAIVGLVIVAALAEPTRWRQTVVLAAALSVISTLIFKIGLGLQAPILTWPF